ncbi:iron ABC transporter permease [Dongia mobilis]|uniref:FecCD family ABC transporter permease n=1 Tax=Dongia sp. TaxID=1977262 RepID=UPI0026F13455
MSAIDMGGTPVLEAVRIRRRWRVVMVLGFLACLATLLAVGVGPLDMVALDIVGWVLHLPLGEPLTGLQQSVIFDIRLPRVVMALLAGVGLAVSGCLMQSLFRNPLADPGLVGVSSGAALAAAVTIVLAEHLPVWFLHLGPFALPAAAAVGSLVATLAILRLADLAGGEATIVLLLAGIGIGVLAEVGIGFLIFISNEQELRDLTFWRMGSLAGNGWTQTAIIAVFAWRIAPALNALALGDDVAGHLGIPVTQLQRGIVIAVAAAIGAVVAFSGMIGFLGLVAPHLARLLVGQDHRWLVPASALIGCVIMAFGDLVTRIAVAPAELPIGLVTGALGGPVFLFLLVRQIRHGAA